jgi:hypothetical protein
VPANSVVGYPDGEDGRRAPAAAWTPALAPVPAAGGAAPRLAARALKHAPAARAETMRRLAIYRTSAALNKAPRCRPPGRRYDGYLVDSASSHMLVLKIKPCMSKYKQLYRETANGSLNQLSFI